MADTVVVADQTYYHNVYDELIAKAPLLGLSGTRLLLLLKLLHYYNPHNPHPFPKQARLANDLGIGLRNCNRVIAALKKAGFIEVKKFTGRTNIINLSGFFKRLRAVSVDKKVGKPKELRNIGVAGTPNRRSYITTIHEDRGIEQGKGGENVGTANPAGLEPDGSIKETASPQSPEKDSGRESEGRRLRVLKQLKSESVGYKQAREEAVRACLRAYKMRTSLINQFFKDHQLDRLEAVVDASEDFKINQPAGFVRRALSEGWSVKPPP